MTVSLSVNGKSFVGRYTPKDALWEISPSAKAEGGFFLLKKLSTL
jgi:hypothetical protein